MKLRESHRLVIFVLLVLATPALFSRILPAKGGFDARPIDHLRAKQPNLVLVGDSMLGSRIDERLLEEKVGQRVEALWNGGAASGCWYLVLKNHVVASGIRPKRVFIFFRDRLLTNARFRTNGIFRPYVESLMRDDEPVCRIVLGNDAQTEMVGPERWVTAAYPVNARRNMLHQRISEMIFRKITARGHDAKILERRVNSTFDVARMRGETIKESIDVDEKSAGPFDPDPRRSFLPHIVDAAAAAKIPLCFVRVKRHAEADGHVAQSEALRQYIADLRAWLASRGCALIDFTDDPQFTPDMYLKAHDDHIGPWAKARSTEIFASRLQTESQIKP